MFINCQVKWCFHVAYPSKTLRHVFHHGTYQDPGLHKRLDIRPNMNIWAYGEQLVPQPLPSFNVRSTPLHIQRLSDRRIPVIEGLLAAAQEQGHASILDADSWVVDEVYGPNTTDKETVLSFSKMTLDAYTLEPFTGEWQNVKGGFNYSQSFGWERDGLRGHIFADTDNSTIVISLKGTSPGIWSCHKSWVVETNPCYSLAVFDGAETTANDKVNDNLFFSCCCGEQGQFLWRQVCSCRLNTYTCNQTCLVEELRSENRYYRAALDLYSNVTELYPGSNVWLAGHSLGGSVSSLLGLTFGIPVITFEAPGEALAAKRLGLPVPPDSVFDAPQTRKYSGSFHFGQTADPIFMGVCNTATSACTLGGYAMETLCHTGHTCIYDTVQDKGWRVGIGNHKIIGTVAVIESYDTVPECSPDTECEDCILWKFIESDRSSTTTSSSSSSSTSRTRTSVCRTPGWWGMYHS